MRISRILLSAGMALSLVGCAPLLSALTGVPPAPQAVADKTVLDEQLASGAELAYKAERIALELAVDAGVLKGERAAQAARLDNAAFQALQAVRAAYRAGNATGYIAALAEARSAIAAALAVISTKG